LFSLEALEVPEVEVRQLPLSPDEKEKAEELELDDRELQRECSETLERGEADLFDGTNGGTTGLIQEGTAI